MKNPASDFDATLLQTLMQAEPNSQFYAAMSDAEYGRFPASPAANSGTLILAIYPGQKRYAVRGRDNQT